MQVIRSTEKKSGDEKDRVLPDVIGLRGKDVTTMYNGCYTWCKIGVITDLGVTMGVPNGVKSGVIYMVLIV